MFWIEDPSTNGTYINKALLGKACELKPGDEIELLHAQSVGEDEHLAYVFEFTTPKRMPRFSVLSAERPRNHIRILRLMHAYQNW